MAGLTQFSSCATMPLALSHKTSTAVPLKMEDKGRLYGQMHLGNM